MSIFQHFTYTKSEDLNNKWPPPFKVFFITGNRLFFCGNPQVVHILYFRQNSSSPLLFLIIEFLRDKHSLMSSFYLRHFPRYICSWGVVTSCPLPTFLLPLVHYGIPFMRAPAYNFHALEVWFGGDYS